MSKYRVYEKIKDRYIIQNTEDLDIELIDKETYQEGINLGLLEWYNIKSEITRKLVTAEDFGIILFEAKYYQIVLTKSIDMKTGDYFKSLVVNIKASNLDLIQQLDESEGLVTVPIYLINNKFQYAFVLESSPSYTMNEFYRLQTPSLNLEIQVCGSLVTTSDLFSYSPLVNLDLNYLDTSESTDMSKMFYECNYLRSLKLNIDTQRVIDMEAMFKGCRKLENLDLSSFDTSNVESMNGMFYDCINLKEIDITHFKVEKVKDLRNLFLHCHNLKSLDLSTWVLSNKVKLEGLIVGCKNITDVDLSCLRGELLLIFDTIFSGCENLSHLTLYSNKILNCLTDIGEGIFLKEVDIEVLHDE